MRTETIIFGFVFGVYGLVFAAWGVYSAVEYLLTA